MIKPFVIKGWMLISLLLLVNPSAFHAQDLEKEIYKKYTLKDSATVYKSAEMLLFSDNTFVNFGIIDDKEAHEQFVWYKSGTWVLAGDKITCQKNERAVSNETITKLVKHYYRMHPDRVLIENYYEFAREPYRSGDFTVRQEEVTDHEKNIAYKEIKL